MSTVAPFENGKPDIEDYDYIYGCFLEEEVLDDEDDRHNKSKNHESDEGGRGGSGENGGSTPEEKPKKKFHTLNKKSSKKEKTENLPGKLYRLVKQSYGRGGGGGPCMERWFFYNDTKDFRMIVTGYFGAMSELRANDHTNMWREMPTGFVIAELVVPPLSTLAYIEGSVRDGCDLRFHALPV